jgi:hypothetical protein
VIRDWDTNARNEYTDPSAYGENKRMWHDTSKPLAKAKQGENNEDPAVRNGIQRTLMSTMKRNMYTPLEEYSTKGFSISDVPAAMEAYNGVGKLIVVFALTIYWEADAIK